MRYQRVLGVCLAASVIGACGGDDDDAGLVCGNGTEELDGECIVVEPDAGIEPLGPADRRPCEHPFGPVQDGALFVDATYSGGDSNGTGERPFASIQDAIDVASPGQQIGIAAGTYAEDLTIDAALSLEGRCANEVIVEGSIHVENTGGVAIRGLTVRDGQPGLLADNVQPEAGENFGLSIRFVRATENTGAGLEMNGSAVEILDSEFTQTQAAQGGNLRELGSGIFINDGSIFDIRTSIIIMNGFMGIDVADATGQPARIVEGETAKATATTTSSGIIIMNGIIGNGGETEGGGGVRVGGAPSGIAPSTEAPLVQIVSNDFSDNDGDCIQVFSSRVAIMGNNLEGAANSLAGLRLEAATGTIGSNSVSGFPEGGILMTSSQAVAIANNTLTDNSDVGIQSFNCRGISIAGNEILNTRDGASEGDTGHGVYIHSDRSPGSIGEHDLTGNTVADNAGVGVAVSGLDDGDAVPRFVTIFGNTIARNGGIGIDLFDTRAVGMFENALLNNTGFGLRCVDGPGQDSRVFFDDNVLRGTTASGSGLDGDAILMSNCHISIDDNVIQENARNGVVMVNGTDGGCDRNDVTDHASNGGGAVDLRLDSSAETGMGLAMNNPLATQATINDNSDLDLSVISPPGN